MRRPNHKVSFNGQPQIWVGVNFWSRSGGPLMWRHYDPKLVREELDAMKEHGMTLTRSFFYWPDFMPTPDRLDEALVAHFHDFLDAHVERGMTSIPTFLVGHMSGQNWDPPWRGDRDLFEDVWFVARQAWYVRELTARFWDHPAVVAWLLTNEVPIYGDWKSRGNGALRAESVLSWAQILIDAVRAGGGYHPVSIGEGAWGVEINGTDNGFRVRDIAGLVDFLGPHVYRMETDQVRQHLGAAFICELLDFNQQPVIMEEFGVTSDYTSDENAAHYYRQTLHHTLLAGATGWITWNNTDYDDLYTQAPYSHHPFELHFGLIDKHGRAKPAALEVKKFAELLERIDFAGCERPDTRIAMIVPSYLENQYPFTAPDDPLSIVENLRQAYVAAREADLPIKLVREADGLLWQPAQMRDLARGVAAGGGLYGRTVSDPLSLAPGELDPRAAGPGLPKDGALYLVPSVKQLTAPTWRELRALAEGGATVYVSYFVGVHENQRGPWWPDLDETFGVKKQLRYGLVNRIEDDDRHLRVRAPLRLDQRRRTHGIRRRRHGELTRLPARRSRRRRGDRPRRPRPPRPARKAHRHGPPRALHLPHRAHGGADHGRQPRADLAPVRRPRRSCRRHPRRHRPGPAHHRRRNGPRRRPPLHLAAQRKRRPAPLHSRHRHRRAQPPRRQGGGGRDRARRLRRGGVGLF